VEAVAARCDAVTAAPTARRVARDRLAVPDAAAAVAADMPVDAAVTDATAAVADARTEPIAVVPAAPAARKAGGISPAATATRCVLAAAVEAARVVAVALVVVADAA
jgi:hypothetical protein